MHLKSLNRYFERHASKQSLFQAEFEVRRDILELIELADKISKEKIVQYCKYLQQNSSH